MCIICAKPGFFQESPTTFCPCFQNKFALLKQMHSHVHIYPINYSEQLLNSFILVPFGGLLWIWVICLFYLGSYIFSRDINTYQ